MQFFFILTPAGSDVTECDDYVHNAYSCIFFNKFKRKNHPYYGTGQKPKLCHNLLLSIFFLGKVRETSSLFFKNFKIVQSASLLNNKPQDALVLTHPVTCGTLQNCPIYKALSNTCIFQTFLQT